MKATLIHNKIKGKKILISETYHKDNFVIKNLASFSIKMTLK